MGAACVCAWVYLSSKVVVIQMEGVGIGRLCCVFNQALIEVQEVVLED